MADQFVTIPLADFELLHEMLRVEQAEVKRLQAEVERLLVDNGELQDECDQWERKQEQSWVEIAELRAEVAGA